MKPVAAYVTVTDMERSIVFYNALFQCIPSHIEERYSFYDLDGFSFGLFNAAYDDQHVSIGNNQVLCFQVDDIYLAYERIKDITPKIDANLFETDRVRLFQFSDLDGNRLEVFQENK